VNFLLNCTKLKKNMNKYLMIVIALFTFSCKKDEQTTGSLIIENVVRNNSSEKTTLVGNDTYITGYTQTSSNNQDAYVMKQTSGQTVWARYYDKSTDDSRGVAIAVSGTDLVVAFSCTGGNTDFKATAGSFQNSYGSGGGASIVYLTRMNAQNGDMIAATFIGGQLDTGKTNTLRPEDNNTAPITILAGQKVQFRATKAYDRGDGRLTPNIGNDADCKVSPSKWIGLFDSQMKLLEGDCQPQ
jgi:hypothetical protein